MIDKQESKPITYITSTISYFINQYDTSVTRSFNFEGQKQYGHIMYKLKVWRSA